MRVEVSYTGVAKNRVYFVTEATAGRPRKTDAIVSSKKVFATGATRSEAISNYLEAVDFSPANTLA